MSDQPAPLTIALVIAGTHTPRTADVLLPWLEGRLRARDWVKLHVLDLIDLPLDWYDRPSGAPGPASAELTEADGVVVLTPEYNHAYPGQLKQFIDAHHREWAYKPVTVVAHGAESGGIRAVEALRTVFAELRAVTIRNAVALHHPREQIVNGVFTPPARTEAALAATLAELRWWALTLRDGRDRYALPD